MEATAKNKSLKTAKIIYWICTGILALFLLSGAFFINSKIAIDAMHHLGVPEWFRWELSIGHIIGGLLLVIPVGRRLKEWNYVALGIDYISATIAYVSLDGVVPNSLSPLISMALLIVSYVYYHKIESNNLTHSAIAP
ncbi:MAG: DoxX family protein [Ginsengibacter sp.]